MTRREWVLTALVGLTAGAGGYAYSLWLASGRDPAAHSAESIMAVRLPNLDGKVESLEQWRGKVLVVNYWATWCAPCRDEIPVFVRLQDRYRERGLQFIGIALDQPHQVRPFAAELRMNFPILIGDIGAIDLTRKLGNRAGALPFTAIIGRTAEKIAATHVGALTESRLETLIAPLL